MIDVVFFELRGRRCALPVEAVREVLPMPSVTPVPLAPPAVRGLAALHGHPVTVLDLGVWLAPGSDGRGDPAPFRGGADKILIIEAVAAADPTPVRAALVVDRVMRLGAVDETHSRPPPPGPAFLTATVLDVEGPALLLDADQAIDCVRDAIGAAVHLREAAGARP